MSTQLTRPDAEDLFHRLSQEARRRRRRRRVARALSVFAAAALVGGTLVWATTSLFGLRADRTRPADAGARPNYVFSDIEVREGWIDPRTGELDRTMATVSYRWAWSSDEYPGDHTCTVTVLDAAGKAVGRERAQFNLLGPGPAGPHDLPVSVSGAPAGAEIVCDPRREDTPVAYLVSRERVTGTFDWVGGWEGPPPEGVVVAFDVAWSLELPDYPSMNACTVTVSRPSGEVVAVSRVDLEAGPGRIDQRVWRDEFSDVAAIEDADFLLADVECHPWSEADLLPEEH